MDASSSGMFSKIKRAEQKKSKLKDPVSLGVFLMLYVCELG
jgi:hypothetical protein